MQILTWNLEWASPTSKRAKLIREQIDAIDPDVACYTEVIEGLLPSGHVITSTGDYGYPQQHGRRKVLLWSKYPWTQVDAQGHSNLPPGRFISGVTAGIRFVGVCIPWKDAHVRTGRKDRTPWQDHLTYCQALKPILARYADEPTPVCILGDYNQRIPRVSQPLHVANALIDAIPQGYQIITKNILDPEGKLLIDHFTLSPNLTPSNITIIPRYSPAGARLSDHAGVVMRITLKSDQY